MADAASSRAHDVLVLLRLHSHPPINQPNLNIKNRQHATLFAVYLPAVSPPASARRIAPRRRARGCARRDGPPCEYLPSRPTFRKRGKFRNFNPQGGTHGDELLSARRELVCPPPPFAFWENEGRGEERGSRRTVEGHGTLLAEHQRAPPRALPGRRPTTDHFLGRENVYSVGCMQISASAYLR